MANKNRVTLKDQSLAKNTEVQLDNMVDSAVSLIDGGTVTGTLAYKEKISLLTDAGATAAIRSALTIDDTGTHFIVPALTSGPQTLALPAVTADNVGWNAKFTMLGTAAQIFKLQTAASADKIITAEADADGTFTINASADAFHFAAEALVGASFRITMISATAATAFHVSDIVHGLAAGTGETIAA